LSLRGGGGVCAAAGATATRRVRPRHSTRASSRVIAGSPSAERVRIVERRTMDVGHPGNTGLRDGQGACGPAPSAIPSGAGGPNMARIANVAGGGAAGGGVRASAVRGGLCADAGRRRHPDAPARRSRDRRTMSGTSGPATAASCSWPPASSAPGAWASRSSPGW
jgi:hypothetical protein